MPPRLERPIDAQRKNVDLEAAYQQLAISEGDLWATFVAVYNPHTAKPELRQLYALPFGGTGAVMNFNWAARALAWMANSLLLMTCTSFFDYFPQLEDEDLEDTENDTLVEFFTILGWKVSTDKRVESPFTRRFKVLGVVIDLLELKAKKITVMNTEERKREIKESIEDVLKAKVLSPVEAASLRGRMGYVYLQCAGKPMAPALHTLSQRAEAKWKQVGVDLNLAEALQQLSWFFTNAPPRLLDFRKEAAECIIFTDGAYEEGVATCGGVIWSATLGQSEAFGFRIPDNIVQEWHDKGSDNCVAQA